MDVLNNLEQQKSTYIFYLLILIPLRSFKSRNTLTQNKKKTASILSLFSLYSTICKPYISNDCKLFL